MAATVLEAKEAGLTSAIAATAADLRTELLKTKTAEQVSNAVRYGMVLDSESKLATAIRATLAELKRDRVSVNTRLEMKRSIYAAHQVCL